MLNLLTKSPFDILLFFKLKQAAILWTVNKPCYNKSLCLHEQCNVFGMMTDVSLVRDTINIIFKENRGWLLPGEYKKFVKMNLSPNPSENLCNRYDFRTLWDLRLLWADKVGLKEKILKIFDFLALTLRARTVLKILQKCRQFCSAGLLHSSKLVHLDGKKLACFTWNIMHNLINFVFFSKSNRKWWKNGWN